MISGFIHPLSGTDELADFRTSTKILAQIVYNRPEVKQGHGNSILTKITPKILFGNPTLIELMRWYPKAQKLGRKI